MRVLIFIFFSFFAVLSWASPLIEANDSEFIPRSYQPLVHLHQAHPRVYTVHFLTKSPIQKKKRSWDQHVISLVANHLPLNILMNHLLSSNSMDVSYQKGAFPNRFVTMHYTGTIHGALQSISNQLNYHYSISNHHLVWESQSKRSSIS